MPVALLSTVAVSHTQQLRQSERQVPAARALLLLLLLLLLRCCSLCWPATNATRLAGTCEATGTMCTVERNSIYMCRSAADLQHRNSYYMMCIARLSLKFPFPPNPNPNPRPKMERKVGKIGENRGNRGKQGKMAVLKAGKTRSPGKFRGIPGENQTKLLDRMACIYMCNRPRANYFVICALGTSVTIITSFVIFLQYFCELFRRESEKNVKHACASG